MQSTRDFHFNVYNIFSSLVFARAVSPISKHKTFHDILPSLFKTVDFSYDQLLDAVELIGSEEVHYSYKSCIEEYEYSYTDDSGKTIKKEVKEKRVITFNPKLQKIN